VSMAHFRTVIEAWRREYNERPTKSPCGSTPAQYVNQLAARPLTMPDDSGSVLLLQAGGRRRKRRTLYANPSWASL